MGGDVFRDEFSLAFDGSNDYVNCGSDSSLDVGTSEFSVSIWFKRTVADDRMTMVAKGNSFTSSPYDNDGWALGVFNTNNYLYFDIHAGSGGSSIKKSAIYSVALDANRWYHVVATRTTNGANSVYSLYVDGVRKNFVTAVDGGADDLLAADGTISDANNDFTIGRESGGSEYFTGNISDVAYYNKGLTKSEVKTLYNGREPYNHKEGVCSGNLQAWWRMGDGNANNRRFQYVENSASSAGSKLIMSSTFGSDEDGWLDYSSGTVARSTDISSHSGGAGVLKCTTDTTSQWLGKTANITSGMESGKIYIAEGYVYIPSSWSGTRDIYIYSADQFGDATTNIGEHDYNIAQHGTKDEWQRIFYTFLCQEDSGSGAIYLRAAGGDNLENGDFVYLDDFKITEIDKLNSGLMLNMEPGHFEGDTP